MRVPVVSLVILFVLAAWPFARALAGGAAADAPRKAPDLQTIGGVTGPVTTTPIDLTAPAAAAPSRATESFGTTLPAGTGAPSAAQAAKRAAAPVAAPAIPAANSDKLPDWSAPPEAPTGRPLNPEQVEALALAAAQVPAGAARGHGIADVLGPLPRVAWTTGRPVKPEAVVTAGAPTGLDAPPAPARATASAKAPAPKPAGFATTGARDPNAPPPAAAKPRPAKEDRP
jgi:hypothetical protein